MSKRTLCEINDEINDNVKTAIRKLEYAVSELGNSECAFAQQALSYLSDAIFDVGGICSIVNEARKAGQSMENRLYAYRKAIENLGFTRNGTEENK